MLTNLTNATWWKDAALRALYTALAIALPYLGASLVAQVPWLTIALTASLGFVASLVTSIAGLPEVEGVNLPWWLAAVERVVKTFAQSLAAGFIGATLITDVDWAFVLQAAALAALTSLVRLILATLPADPTPALVMAEVEAGPSTVNVVHTYVDERTVPAADPAAPRPPVAG